MLTEITNSSTFELLRDLGVILTGSAIFLFGISQTYKMFWPYVRPVWRFVLNTVLEEHIKQEQEEHERLRDLFQEELSS